MPIVRHLLSLYAQQSTNVANLSVRHWSNTRKLNNLGCNSQEQYTYHKLRFALVKTYLCQSPMSPPPSRRHPSPDPCWRRTTCRKWQNQGNRPKKQRRKKVTTIGHRTNLDRWITPINTAASNAPTPLKLHSPKCLSKKRLAIFPA